MTAPDAPLTLGQRVRFRDVLVRRTVFMRPEGALVDLRYRVWRRRGEHMPALAVAGEGIVVGTRTLADGHTPILGYDEGYGFVPSEAHRAVLIATHVRHKPVLALLEDVEPLPERDDTAELVAAVESGLHYVKWAEEHGHMGAPSSRTLIEAALARVKGGERS